MDTIEETTTPGLVEQDQPQESSVEAQEVAEDTIDGGEPEQSADVDEKSADLPDWVREKLRKVQNECRNLRQRLKDQEPLVQAAQEAERAKMSELERAQADVQALQAELARRDTLLLIERYGIPEDMVEFIGEGSFEEKEARAAKIGKLVKQDAPHGRPPTDRPVESLKPGAAPAPPPVEDHSYPAHWLPKRAEQG